MATFPTEYSPEYGAQVETKHSVMRAQFGDGYIQRVPDGINSKRRVWSLNYKYKTADIDIIEDFINDTLGAEAFIWTPPRGPIGRWELKDGSMSRTVSNYGYEDLSVTFSEVFE